jgi:LPS export ABC transporter protein LptC
LFDEQNNENHISADYGIAYNSTNLIDLRGDVKVATHTKDTLFAEQLYYDRSLNWIFTDLPVVFRTANEKISGTGFDSDKAFERARVLKVTGTITVEE